MEVYVVVLDEHISTEAYKTLEEAQEFIKSRMVKGNSITNETPMRLEYIDPRGNNHTWNIFAVSVAK